MAEDKRSPFAWGDKVRVKWYWSEQWVPGRVLNTFPPRRFGNRSTVRAVVSAPSEFWINSSVRVVPAGTPLTWTFGDDFVRLVERDAGWNPFAVDPFMTPDEYSFIAGVPGFPRKLDGVSHVGAYQSVSDYRSDDLVWVWEESWRPAVVVEAKDRWIRVRYLGGFKDGKGSPAKAYRATHVCPVICDFPEPVRAITVKSYLRRLTPQEAYDWAVWDGCRNPGSIAQRCARAWGKHADGFVAHNHIVMKHPDGTFTYVDPQSGEQ
jgi:hypothetical protein